MQITSLATNEATLTELGSRMAQHRLGNNQSQAELAKAAGVSTRTVMRLEAGESTTLSNLVRILRALGHLERLDMVIPPQQISPLEQLKLEGQKRKRASGTRQTAKPQPASNWSWGDQAGEF